MATRKAKPRINYALDEPINPRCPPQRVRHRPTGMVTDCTTWVMWKFSLSDLQPYFQHKGQEDDYRIKLRRWEAAQALKGGDPYAGMTERRSMSFEFDDEADAELAALGDADPA